MVFKLTLFSAGIIILSAMLIHHLMFKEKPTSIEIIEEQAPEKPVTEEKPVINPVVIEVKVSKEEPVKKKRKPAPNKVKK